MPSNIRKIQNHELKQAGSRRQENTRSQRECFLIVCEGKETEPLYFKSFQCQVRPNSITIIGGAGDPLGVVNKAIKQKNANQGLFTQIWTVFDRDEAPSFNQAINRAKSNKIKCAWSNEAFELWFILHFNLMENAVSRKQYANIINKAIGNKFHYEKTTPNMYQILQKHGNQQQAITNAKAIEKQHHGVDYATHNPCTKIYKLIEELNKIIDQK